MCRCTGPANHRTDTPACMQRHSTLTGCGRWLSLPPISMGRSFAVRNASRRLRTASHTTGCRRAISLRCAAANAFGVQALPCHNESKALVSASSAGGICTTTGAGPTHCMIIHWVIAPPSGCAANMSRSSNALHIMRLIVAPRCPQNRRCMTSWAYREDVPDRLRRQACLWHTLRSAHHPSWCIRPPNRTPF